jgi:nitric oxide reductase NorD protein
MSSDSWVANRRVLDVEIDSIGMTGLLLQEMSDFISVLGSWSETRHHCYLQVIKDFKTSWNVYYENARQLSPRGYTRLGPAVRQATSELVKTKSKNKMLIIMTDGKPTDLDKYEGRYGIEDMRHAILEAEQRGVYVHALAIDSAARHYFPQLFNSNHYQILSDPKKLPEQLFKICLAFTSF